MPDNIIAPAVKLSASPSPTQNSNGPPDKVLPTTSQVGISVSKIVTMPSSSAIVAFNGTFKVTTNFSVASSNSSSKIGKLIFVHSTPASITATPSRGS